VARALPDAPPVPNCAFGSPVIGRAAA